MSDGTAVDITFYEESAVRWEQSALRADERANKAAGYSQAVEEHLRTVAYSHWMIAAQRRAEACGGSIDFSVDQSLSPR